MHCNQTERTLKKKHTIHISVLIFLLLFTGQALSAPPSLDLPIRCTPGSTCFIQNYFDHDSSDRYVDYSCGYLSYNGHTGTDFRLRDLAALKSEVAVLAAASGIVRGIRNTEPDMLLIKRGGRTALGGKDAGNGVWIDHGDGWATQYSHLLQGSVRVHEGDHVTKGETLGFVGLSGNTEFPHLDFSVFKKRKALDPFNPEATSCGTSSDTLWSPAAIKALHYQPTGILVSGFSAVPPTRELVEAGNFAEKSLPADAESISFWVEFFGLHKNDRLTLKLYDPAGKQLSSNRMLLPGNKAVMFAASGKRRKEPLWPTGRFRAVIRLERAGAIIIQEQSEVEVMLRAHHHDN